jgi:hypothetical protein
MEQPLINDHVEARAPYIVYRSSYMIVILKRYE